MNTSKTLMFSVLVVALWVGSSLAELQQIDLYSPGDALITRDTGTGLDWLDVPLTVGLSYNNIIAGSGGWIDDGWRHATTAEVCDLMQKLDAAYPPTCPGDTGLLPGQYEFVHHNYLGMTLGVVNISIETYGCFNDLDLADPNVGYVIIKSCFGHCLNSSRIAVLENDKSPDYSAGDVGHFLVEMFGATTDPCIVNINAKVHSIDNPIAVGPLDRGDWLVTPIDQTMGGTYTAWKAWAGAPSGCDANGMNCNYGWVNHYVVSSPFLGENIIVKQVNGVSARYATPEIAFENAISFLFHLDYAENLNFSITDSSSYLFDNSGGVSLLLEQISSQNNVVTKICDNLWNVKWFHCDYGHENNFTLNRDGTPVCGSGNCSGPPDSCWGPVVTVQQGQSPGISWSTSEKGRLSLSHAQDYQVYGDTYLYVDSNETIYVPAYGDIAHVWLNNVFMSGNPIEMNLIEGWNHVEWTSYNQNQGTAVTIDYPFSDNVDCMSSLLPACADSNDNDLDAHIDYPDDLGCTNLLDVSELSGDFDDDWDVDPNDLGILASFWLQEELLVDIAPAPGGNGIANMEDYVVFAENWLKGTAP